MNAATNTIQQVEASIAQRAAQLRSERLYRKYLVVRGVERRASMAVDAARLQGRPGKVRRLERVWFKKSLKTQGVRDAYLEVSELSVMAVEEVRYLTARS